MYIQIIRGKHGRSSFLAADQCATPILLTVAYIKSIFIDNITTVLDDFH